MTMTNSKSLTFAAAFCLALVLSACEEVPTSSNVEARAALEAGQLRAAEASVGAIFAADAADAETQAIKLDVMLTLGDGYAAMAALDAMPEGSMTQAERRVAKAHALILQGNPKAAADLYQGMEPEDFSEQDYRMTLWALRDLELTDEFEAGLEAGIEAFPESADLSTMAAQALIDRDQPEEALTFADRALASDPHHFDALLVKGELAIEAADLDAALGHYQAASKIYPDFALPLANIAGLQLDLGRVEEAGETLRTARKAHEGEPFVQWQLARHALATNDLETARTALEAARRTFRGNDEFTLFSAQAEERFGNRELALSEYQRYLGAVGEDEAIEAKIATLEAQS